MAQLGVDEDCGAFGEDDNDDDEDDIEAFEADDEDIKEFEKEIEQQLKSVKAIREAQEKDEAAVVAKIHGRTAKTANPFDALIDDKTPQKADPWADGNDAWTEGRRKKERGRSSKDTNKDPFHTPIREVENLHTKFLRQMEECRSTPATIPSPIDDDNKMSKEEITPMEATISTPPGLGGHMVNIIISGMTPTPIVVNGHVQDAGEYDSINGLDVETRENTFPITHPNEFDKISKSQKKKIKSKAKVEHIGKEKAEKSGRKDEDIFEIIDEDMNEDISFPMTLLF